MGTEPVRSCVGCRARRPKGELLRVTVDQRGHVALDVRREAGGRGVYVCPKKSCLLQASRGAMARGLRRRVAAVELPRLFSLALESTRRAAEELIQQALADGRARPEVRAGEERAELPLVTLTDERLRQRLSTLTEQSRLLLAESQLL